MRVGLRIVFIAVFLIAPHAYSEDSALLRDHNGDGLVTMLAFGDSITYGLGDGIAPGDSRDYLPLPPGPQGYPNRIEALAGVQVDTSGVPGEGFLISGIDRLPGVLRGSSADVVIVMEGANDAWQRMDPSSYERALQKAVNITIASGKVPVLFSLPPPCENHSGSRLYTDAYTLKIRHIAAINELSLVDLERVWQTTCDDIDSCNLYNLPDGLHPNTLGYDAIAQAVLAVLYGIDIFAPGGAVDLATATGLAPEAIVIKADPAL